MTHGGELSALRTQLRAVNIEYSALVKAKDGGTSGRLEELRARRHALMALIAKAGRPSSVRPVPVPNGLATVVQAA